MIYQLKKVLVIVLVLLGIVSSVSQAGDEFHVWTPDNITYTALTSARDVAIASDSSIYMLTLNNVKKLDSNGYLLLE